MDWPLTVPATCLWRIVLITAGIGGYVTEITPGGVQSPIPSGPDPKGLAFNSAGDLFETDYHSGNIYKYSPGGVLSIFATVPLLLRQWPLTARVICLWGLDTAMATNHHRNHAKRNAEHFCRLRVELHRRIGL